MTSLRQDEAALDAVIGMLLLFALVVVLAAGVFFFANGFKDSVPPASVMYGLVTEGADQAPDRWTVRVGSNQGEAAWHEFVWVLRTPQNGTLVARPADTAALATELYWPLPPGAGTGTHSAVAEVGAAGVGGYRLRIADENGDGRFGTGDRAEYTFDLDGDHGHAGGRDDRLPAGTYAFELLHRDTGSVSGMLERSV